MSERDDRDPLALKVFVFVLWVLAVIPAFAGAIYGWKSAIYPPTYMQDAYIWRLFGATFIGGIIPLVGLALLYMQIIWWRDDR